MTRIRSHNWSEAEERVLVDEWLRRKDVMRDGSNTPAAKEARNQAWKEILQVLQDACMADSRNIDQLQKKWNNLKDKAKKEYVKEETSIKEGGAQYRMSALMEHLYINVWGEGAGPTPCSQITVKESPLSELHQPLGFSPAVNNNINSANVSIPMNIFNNIALISGVNEEASHEISDSVLSGETSEGDIETESAAVPRRLQFHPPFGAAEVAAVALDAGHDHQGGHAGVVVDHVPSPAPSLRPSSKRSLPEVSEVAAESRRMRLWKQRLDVAYVTIRCRKEMGLPITMDNVDDVFPADIASFLKYPNSF